MLIKHQNRQRNGNVVVVAAFSLVALFGCISLALDGGVLMDQKRRVQAACDAAALAAAADLYEKVYTNHGLDPNGTASASAIANATSNGYTTRTGCVVTVNIPPQSGAFKDQPGFAEVLITQTQPMFFSQIFGMKQLPVSGRAVARGRRGGIYNAIITLNPSGKGSLNSAGGGTFAVTGSPIQVNSGDAAAMVANGNGTLTATKGFNVVGSPGWSTPGGGTFSGTINSNSNPMPDPLQHLPAPARTELPMRSTNKTQISGGNRTLYPGVYVGGITITGQANVTLSPGVYYMDGGGFSWGGQGNLSGTGVTIYNQPASNSDTISLAGQGVGTMSPPNSGPYQGILLFQDRTSTAPVSVSGNGGLTLSGAFYAASATLTVTGNGTQNVLGAQYISRDLVLNGNGEGAVSWTADSTPGVRLYGVVE